MFRSQILLQTPSTFLLNRPLSRNNIIFNRTIKWNANEVRTVCQWLRKKTTQHIALERWDHALFMFCNIYRSLVPSYMTTCIFMGLNDMRWNRRITFIDTTIFATLTKFPVYCFNYTYFDVNLSNSNFGILSILFNQHTPNSN